VFDQATLQQLTQTLLETNRGVEVLLFLVIQLAIWMIFSLFIVQFLPRKYQPYRGEIFLFFTLVNTAFLLSGILLTLAMLLFGLNWATHRISRPSYESIYFQEQISDFPMVESKFHEGILALDTKYSHTISSDEKIKSLKILYDSNAQGNIAKIKKFLSDSSDETRLYAFALISTYEKALNNKIKTLQARLAKPQDAQSMEQYSFELAQTYWQFIFHGVASEQMTGFYTQKIEKLLAQITHHRGAFVLLGKIKIFNRAYDEAEHYFLKAIELGVPANSLATFFAEIKYEQKKYDEIAPYIIEEEFDIDLRLKPLIAVWRRP